MKKLTLNALLRSINEDSSVNSLIQSSPVCHKIFDPDFKLQFMSKCGVTALKIESIEDYYGHSFPPDFAPKNTRDIFNETMHCAANDETKTIEYSFEIDGNDIWFRTTISPFFDTDDILIYITADSMDITSTKKTEDINKTLLDTTDICLKEIHKNNSPGYTMIFMSPADQNQLGIVNLEKLYGGPYPPVFFPDEAKTALTEGLDRTARTGKTTQVECELFDNDGNSVWYLSTFSVQRKNEVGEVISITGASQNVTERMLNQVALAKSIKEAEKSKEEAELANIAKSEFLARMSHELRTPLNTIIGFSQVMMRSKKDKLTPSQKDDMENVHGAGKHLLQLIDEVLDLARIESGIIDIVREPVNLLNMMDEVLNLTLIWAEQNGIKIVNKIPRQDIFVLADQVRLKQVLLNLISNAIKFNREGGSITISCEETPNIKISIADTGLGIQEDRQDSLFEPFARLHIEETKIEGTGIGLSISKKLVELMHGKISFTSVPDQGTCFSVELPYCEAPLNKDHEVTPSVMTTLDREKTPGLISTILYIEDHPLNISLVEKFLKERDDIKLLSAPQAKLGLELARAHRPDLILMDINLPGMSGLEAIEYLQTYKETKTIPVVAISADAMEEDIERAKRAGFKKYMTKPIDADHFMEIIDECLRS